jgi:hypothetical protein
MQNAKWFINNFVIFANYFFIGLAPDFSYMSYCSDGKSQESNYFLIWRKIFWELEITCANKKTGNQFEKSPEKNSSKEENCNYGFNENKFIVYVITLRAFVEK